MSTVPAAVTVVTLRQKLARVRRLHTRALRERDDARDEVVKLCQERLQLVAERDEARAAIDRVRALHKLVTDHADCPDADTTLGCRCEPNAHAFEYCEYCGTDEECDTIRAIDGSGT